MNKKRIGAVVFASLNFVCHPYHVTIIPDASIPTVKLPVREGRDYLWGKMKAAIVYIYRNHRHEADWFLRTDDDT